MQFCLRNSVNTAGPRLAVLIFVGAFVGLSIVPPALAQFGKKGKKDPAAAAAPAAEEKLPPGMTMSKTQAIAALINALAVNQSEAARETLEQIVVGKTSFGAHSKQAAETALVGAGHASIPRRVRVPAATACRAGRQDSPCRQRLSGGGGAVRRGSCRMPRRIARVASGAGEMARPRDA